MKYLFIIWVKTRRKITESQKYNEGILLSGLDLLLLEQSIKTMPTNTTLESDRHAFQLFSTQSVHSVCKEAWDSCWFLHSATSVMLAHSPSPFTHTERKRNMVKTGFASSPYKGILALDFHAICLPYCLNLCYILHLCHIYRNNNTLKTNGGKWLILRKRGRRCTN